MKRHLQSLGSLLKERDLRATAQRMAIIRALLDLKNGHPTALEIHKVAKKYAENLGLATVYRTLKILEESNIIQVFSINREAHYDLLGGDHSHFICLECGHIKEFQDQSRPIVLQGEGYTIKERTLLLYGLCPQCKVKKGDVTNGEINHREAASKEREFYQECISHYEW